MFECRKEKPTMLSSEIISKIIGYCNRDIVPDEQFDAQEQYPSEWFENYFAFLQNKSLSQHLGDAFYQARFIYKLMNALRLTLPKQRGIIKFQIIQYASICEAVLDFTIDKYFKDEARERFAQSEYVKCTNALSEPTKVIYENEELFLCKHKKGSEN